MAKAVNNTKAVYMPPRGMPISQIEGFEGYDCTIVSVGPTNLVCAFVRAPATSGPYSSWVAENVLYVDADTPADQVPPNGGYVAPVGFTPPAYTPPAPPEDANGNAILPNQVIWANPHTLPTATALDEPVTLPFS